MDGWAVRIKSIWTNAFFSPAYHSFTLVDLGGRDDCNVGDRAESSQALYNVKSFNGPAIIIRDR